MDNLLQIKQICIETDNEWFLTHAFTQIALIDLRLKENTVDFDERECICNTNNGYDCISCEIEYDRNEKIEKLNLNTICYNIYNYDLDIYTKSKWIIHKNLEGEIQGFMLIKYSGICIDDEFTHELVFACVLPKYRKMGILKQMVALLPKEWNIWLEASSNHIQNVENIWRKCGFIYHTTINEQHKIYKKMSEPISI